MAGLLVDQLRLMAGKYPQETGFFDLDARTGLTFAAWEEESNRLARGLVGAVSKGDRVAIYLPNQEALAWVVAYAAIHKAGAVAVPTNNRLKSGELVRVLGHAEVSAAVTSPALLDRLGTARAAVPSLGLVVTTGDAASEGVAPWADVLADDGSEFQVPVAGDDLADVMYTSGTTGTPKGVAVTHDNAAMVPNSDPEWTGDGWIHSSPLFTFAGIGFIYNPMKMGLVSLHQPVFDAGRWLEYVGSERPRFVFIVPAMAQLIVGHPRFAAADLSSIGLCSIGSAPLPFETLRALQVKMPDASVSNSYGMTEAGAAYCVMPKGESLRRKGSVGVPLPPAEVRVVDHEGRDVATGEEGEILIRVPGRARSYYRDVEATAAAWEADGWLHSGDLGRLDDEGFLYIVGRGKDVIIRGGNNVHAADVEEVLYEHPAVLDAAIVGVAHEVLGEDVAAVVVLHPGRAASEDDLAALCRERLAGYKCPRRIEFADALPRNALGKVLKRELRERLARSRARS